MKNIVIILLLIFNISILKSQTANSIANSNWKMPTTCECKTSSNGQYFYAIIENENIISGKLIIQ